jgi:hypothetical protein
VLTTALATAANEVGVQHIQNLARGSDFARAEAIGSRQDPHLAVCWPGAGRPGDGHASCYALFPMALIARRLLLVVGLGFVLGSGCLSPTLPLPPPGEPEVDGPTAEGTATLRGRVPQPYARVYATNWTRVEAEDPRAFGGDYADERGRYIFEIAAQPGDRCELWYEYAGDKSMSRYFEIPEPDL